jgi:preprotein translocase subunit SecA
MMDRIEDETIRYLYFLQVTQGDRPPLPYPDMEEEEDEEPEPEPVAVSKAAQTEVLDFTRNIQRKKEKELADLQFAGSGGVATENKTVVSKSKAGRNDPCPCGSGKKYKKCHGAT